MSDRTGFRGLRALILHLKHVITDIFRDSMCLSRREDLAFYLPFRYKEIN